jgi:hypothetical protein
MIFRILPGLKPLLKSCARSPEPVLKNWALTAERWASSLIHQKEAYKLVLAPYIGDGSPTTQTMWLDELTVKTVNQDAPSPPTELRIVQ